MTRRTQLPDKLFFKIGEVADIVGVKPHALRYWETEFPALRPKKTRGAHRQYSRKDVELAMLPPLQLETFNVFTGSRQLELDVAGRDAIGFLASLLKRLARLGLFPQRMEVSTQAGEIRDRFWLRSVGGAAPTPEQAQRLERHLLSLTQSQTKAPSL